jgi:hypothetical protein
MTIITRSADKKGRITLPKQFAGHLLQIEIIDDKELTIKKAVALPERELWLHQNEDALSMVVRGIGQARAGEFVEGPNVTEDLDEIGTDHDDDVQSLLDSRS